MTAKVSPTVLLSQVAGAYVFPFMNECNCFQSRPFGVALLVAGWDDSAGPLLYHTDPSGTFSSCTAMAIGSGSEGAQTTLEEEYKPDLSFEEAETLALSTLKQVMEEKVIHHSLTLKGLRSSDKIFLRLAVSSLLPFCSIASLASEHICLGWSHVWTLSCKSFSLWPYDSSLMISKHWVQCEPKRKGWHDKRNAKEICQVEKAGNAEKHPPFMSIPG